MEAGTAETTTTEGTIKMRDLQVHLTCFDKKRTCNIFVICANMFLNVLHGPSETPQGSTGIPK